MTNQKRAYNSAVNRGKVNDGTTVSKMIDDLQVELNELIKAKENGSSHLLEGIEGINNDEVFFNTYKNKVAGTIPDELSDLVLISLTIAEFLGIDLQLAVNQKMRYNELRGDNLKQE